MLFAKLEDVETSLMAQINLACEGCDCDREAEELLEDLREVAIHERDFSLVRKLRRLRFQPLRRSKLVDQINERAKLDLANSGRVGEFGDGQFAKWLIEWFSDEGWKIIISFIKAIVAIF